MSATTGQKVVALQVAVGN